MKMLSTQTCPGAHFPPSCPHAKGPGGPSSLSSVRASVWQRFRRSTKETDKKRAHGVAKRWEHEHADPTYRPANAITFGAAARNLETALESRGLSQDTLDFYGVKLSQLVRVFEEGRQGTSEEPYRRKLSTVDAPAVDGYVDTRKSEGASAHTVAKELVALRQVLKHARRRGEYDKDPTQVMPQRFDAGYVPRTRRVTEAEAWALITELPEGAARYVAFVCATTARDSAVARAVGSDLVDAGIKVRDYKTEGSTRTVPLTPVTERFALFAFWGVGPEKRVAQGLGSIRHALRRACTRLNLAPLSPNDLRRSVAHWLIAQGVPRYDVARFMGHASTKMLDKVYGRTDDGELGASLARAFSSSDRNERGRNVDGSVRSMDAVDEVDDSDPAFSAAFVRRGGIEPPTRGFSVPIYVQ
jgi:integrase